MAANTKQTPASLYALWLYIYSRQNSSGVPIDMKTSNYNPEQVLLPTRDTDMPLPHVSVYSKALSIMHLPDIVTINTQATERLDSTADADADADATTDPTLLTLRLDDKSPTGLIAETNRPDTIISFPDVYGLTRAYETYSDHELRRYFIEHVNVARARRRK